MKWFLRILAATVALVVLLFAGLSLYLTDARLRELVLPPLNEHLGGNVQVERVGFTLLRTFPQFGLVVEGLSVADSSGAPVVALAELLVDVDLMPLLGGDVRVNRLHLVRPELTYRVFADGTTNLDFLLATDTTAVADTAASTARIDLDDLSMEGGRITYDDRQSDLTLTLAAFDLQAAIRYGQVLESDLEGRIGGVSVVSGGARLLDSLTVSFRQTSAVDLGAETLELREGVVSIRGLELTTSGRASAWSGDSMAYAFTFASASDNFGALLDLVPEEQAADLAGVETRGSLQFEGRIEGTLADAYPTFDVVVRVADGYLKYPDVPRPIEGIRIDLTATNAAVDIRAFEARASANTVSVTGRIANPLEPTGTFALNAAVKADLGTVKEFYPLDEDSVQVAGGVDFRLDLAGRLDDPARARIAGGLKLDAASVRHPDLMQPIRDMNGELVFNNRIVELKSFRLGMGSSDFDLSGQAVDYLAFFEAVGSTAPGTLTARYASRRLHVDEIYDINAETEEEPLYMELPNVNARLDARIDTMIFLGMRITEIRGRAATTPRQIEMTDATARIFDGGMNGYLKWEIPQPDYTWVTFRGGLENVRSEAFLKEFQLGGESELHQYVSGGLTVRADFRTAMDEMFLQDAKTINGNGTFGMDRARVRNHPMQVKVAELFGANEFRDLSLDSWTAKFDIKDGLMTLTDMNLTSQGLGMLLNGTHNLVDDRINYRVRLTLPPNWSARVEGLLTKDGVEALKTDGGVIAVPILITGTSENPSVGLDKTAIAEAVAIYLRNRARDGAGRLIDGLIRRN